MNRSPGAPVSVGLTTASVASQRECTYDPPVSPIHPTTAARSSAGSIRPRREPRQTPIARTKTARAARTTPRDPKPAKDCAASVPGSIAPISRSRLSRRELDVVALVVEGRSNDEVGAALGIGAKTVETHLARLFERFSIASRTELATRALREGWLDLPPD